MPSILRHLILSGFVLQGAGCAHGCDGDPQARRRTPVVPAPPSRLDVITDVDVKAAIEAELLLARGVDGNAIDVLVDDGIVTLRGAAANLLARQRAVRIAEQVKNVRAVINRIELTGTPRPNRTLARDVDAALSRDATTRAYEVRATAAGGVVTLHGRVPSWQARRLTERVASGVAGVLDIANELAVATPNSTASAEQLRAAIKNILEWDVRVDHRGIDVNVHGGDVALSGVVGTAYERTLAYSAAWIPGVEQVNVDALHVRDWAKNPMIRTPPFRPHSDTEAQRAVVQAFTYDPRVSAFALEVEVREGVATLSGVVDNVKARRAAAQNAHNTWGISRVRNNIKVRPEGIPSDERLAARVKSSLSRDPYLGGYEMRVVAHDGVVILSGEVDSYFDKWQAGDTAARTVGAVEVRNNLLVSYDLPLHTFTLYDWDPVAMDYDYQMDLPRLSDDEVAARVRSQLLWSPFVESDDVRVAVENGVATLHGSVASLAARRSAVEEAYEAGASGVVNQLRVSPQRNPQP